MQFDRKHTSVTIGGRKITFETGKIARQANGAVLVRSGDTVLLNTACAADTASEEIDFLPLRVDHQEKFSATGKTLGGFIKREGRPSDTAVLTGRLVDRPLRPLFDKNFRKDVQIIITVLSLDKENDEVA